MKILVDQLQNVRGGADYIVVNTEGTKLANQNADQVGIMNYILQVDYLQQSSNLAS